MTRRGDIDPTTSETALQSETASAGAESARADRVIPMVEERLDSRDLFAVSRLITIVHGEQLYQLRLTAQNKLILTK